MTNAWDGRPEKPERAGYHWLACKTDRQSPWCAFWDGDKWGEDEGIKHTPATAADWWLYYGPCFTPAEVASREAAAYRRGQEDMRERAAVAARFVPLPEEASAVEAHGRMTAAMQAGLTILALPIQEAPHD